MINVKLTAAQNLSPADAHVEMVERKGIGHPDTMCDALAEALSRALCQYYLDQFGLILHHNVDKALLWGGASQPAFNGGRVLKPMELFLAGRATCEFQGSKVPVEELVMETSRQWLREHLHALDVDRHVKIHSMIRPGSSDLVELYLRQRATGVAMANDTSCGVGFAPLDELEKLVLEVARHLNSSGVKANHPELGEDIKVMGVRENGSIVLTVACAFIDRFVHSLDDYVDKKRQLTEGISEFALNLLGRAVKVMVNTADQPESGSIYLTVTGTSAEAGDDGEVGRGNRGNGLITPYRPMNMEAIAGKNPVTHVGKLYNLIAQRIAGALVEHIPEILHAQCFLVSRIGHPITEPQIVDVKVQLQAGASLTSAMHDAAEKIIQTHLLQSADIQTELLSGRLTVY